jgi:hypothetical protein
MAKRNYWGVPRAFDSWGLKLPKSRHEFEIRFASIEDAETAIKGLEPEIRQYLKVAR